MSGQTAIHQSRETILESPLGWTFYFRRHDGRALGLHARVNTMEPGQIDVAVAREGYSDSDSFSSDPSDGGATPKTGGAGGPGGVGRSGSSGSVAGHGWAESIDPATGRTFYHHAERGESSWHVPDAVREAQEAIALFVSHTGGKATSSGSSTGTAAGHGWTESTDPATGRTFYHHAERNESSWHVPAELQQAAAVTLTDRAASTEFGEDVAGAPPAGHGWTESTDPATGRTFYHHAGRRESSWHVPAEVQRAEEAAAAAPRGDASNTPGRSGRGGRGGGEGHGWAECKDPSSGATFYHHAVTRTSSWDRPASMHPPTTNQPTLPRSHLRATLSSPELSSNTDSKSTKNDRAERLSFLLGKNSPTSAVDERVTEDSFTFREAGGPSSKPTRPKSGSIKKQLSQMPSNWGQSDSSRKRGKSKWGAVRGVKGLLGGTMGVSGKSIAKAQRKKSKSIAKHEQKELKKELKIDEYVEHNYRFSWIDMSGNAKPMGGSGINSVSYIDMRGGKQKKTDKYVDSHYRFDWDAMSGNVPAPKKRQPMKGKADMPSFLARGPTDRFAKVREPSESIEEKGTPSSGGCCSIS